ncbi:MAG: glycosyltransferase family protein [Nitrospirae bacterium]|nr:glycosyltransferase family protein [Nitrospirota bacterium]
MKIGAIVEARMTSSRLPGKIMLPIIGKPALELLIERLRQCKKIDKIIIATTTNHCDEVIVDLAKRCDVGYYRGSELDVLERVYLSAIENSIEVVVEVTSDCPLVDPYIVSEAIEIFESQRYDYVSNIIKRTFPRGLDVQIFKTSVLEDVHNTTKDLVDREHAALHIYEHPEKYKLWNFMTDTGYELESQRLTLDTPEDYFVIRAIFEGLYEKTNGAFSYKEIFEFLKINPDIAALNHQIEQKNPRSYDYTAKARKYLGID